MRFLSLGQVSAVMSACKTQYLAAMALILTTVGSSAAMAQPPIPDPDNFKKFEIKGGLGKLQNPLGGQDAEFLRVEATFTIAPSARTGTLSITADIAQGKYGYSLEQKLGPKFPTRINLSSSGKYRLTGSYVAAPPAKTKYDEIFKKKISKHRGRVTWTAPIELGEGVNPRTLQISGALTMQVCDESTCLDQFARFTAGYQPPAIVQVGRYENPKSHSVITGHIEPRVAAPGDTVRLMLTATPAADWHVYALADRDHEGSFKPTLIGLDVTQKWQVSAATTDAKPHEETDDVGFGEETVRSYEQPVTWTTTITIPKATKPGEYELSGLIGYQTCHTSCDQPLAARFTVKLPVAAQAAVGELPLSFVPAKYGDAAALAETLSANRVKGPFDGKSVVMILGLAFLAGLILNVMPCVLPVIGLKIMAFVSQAGESRMRVFSLNAWYSVGLLSVFMVLATAAVFLNKGWGEHFERPEFGIALAAIIFTFALSFLGVWEIPIPGFVGGSKASGVAEKEGPLGALAKGALTTVLATPCSGPFLGPAVGWAIAQPAWMTYATFGCIGLGMASPYLIIGAFPSTVRFLPKPGAWMDTFKQLMGFVLMGTVVFIFSFLQEKYVIPTMTLLTGLALACWIIGRTPLTAELPAKLKAWGKAALVTGLVALFAFGWLLNFNELAWQPYSRAALDDHRKKGHTVLVDFTADW